MNDLTPLLTRIQDAAQDELSFAPNDVVSPMAFRTLHKKVSVAYEYAAYMVHLVQRWRHEAVPEEDENTSG